MFVVVLSKDDVVELLSWTYLYVVAAPLGDRMLSGVLSQMHVNFAKIVRGVCCDSLV